MHTVTLKTDEKLYGQIVLMADELHLSKSELIRQALISFQESLHKKKMKSLLQEASIKVRAVDDRLIDELDHLASDGLADG